MRESHSDRRLFVKPPPWLHKSEVPRYRKPLSSWKGRCTGRLFVLVAANMTSGLPTILKLVVMSPFMKPKGHDHLV